MTDTVTLYTGTQSGKTINFWGETVTFCKDGTAEVSEEIAKKAAKAVPHDYCFPTRIEFKARAKEFT